MTTLLLHGLGGSRANILAYLEAGPARQHIVAPDIRAHGANPLIGDHDDFSLDVLAKECADALAAEWDGTPVTLVGNSMGAAIALRIARSGRFPLDRVCFLKPSFTDISLPANLAIFPIIAELLSSYPLETALSKLRASGAYEDIRRVSRAGAAAIETQLTQPLAAERSIRLAEIPRNPAYAPETLRPLGCPTVVLASPRDPVHPVEIAETWSAGLRAPILVSPPRDAGHQQLMQWYRHQLGSFLTPTR